MAVTLHGVQKSRKIIKYILGFFKVFCSKSFYLLNTGVAGLLNRRRYTRYVG